MLYEMMTGERPFEGQSITTIMYKIVHENPTPPRALDSSIPSGLSAVIEGSLAKAPEDRYQSGAALVNALENYKNIQADQSRTNAGTVELPAPALTMEALKVAKETPELTPPRRSMKLLAVAVFVLVAIIGLIAYGRRGKPQPTEEASRQTTSSVSPPTPPAAPPSPATGQLAMEKPRPPSAIGNKTTATLTVNSNPPTATIFVDGKSTGMRAQAQLQLTRGEHVVSVRMDGFQPSSATFQVKGGEELQFSPDLKVQVPGMPNIKIPKVDVPGIDVEKLTGLQKEKQLRSSEFWQQWAKGTEASVTGGANSSDLGILVSTKPSGAHISINGSDTGQQSPAIVKESPGTYHLRVHLEGYEPAERDVKSNPVVRRW